MSRSPLRARRILVIAPHSDDEAIAAWGLMRRARRSGARVDVLVVSDGAASHPGSRRWPAQRLVAERHRETRRAMRSLNISPAHIRFLDLPDGALAESSERLRDALVGAIRGGQPADLIVAPLLDDGHHDHRAVAAALAAIPRRGECRLGYRVWPEGAGRGLHDVVVRLDGVAMRRKRAVVRGYRTQAGLITDAQAGFAMTHRHVRAFVGPAERFAILR